MKKERVSVTLALQVAYSSVFIALRYTFGFVSGGEFSFSMFGGAADGAASSGSDGDFVFDFGNPSQGGDGGDTTFNFNFGGESDEPNTAEKNEGFNFFGF
ncbi:hypothetical protein Y032_0420g1156 [Ancylostoma ceylanicum]|uniref:Uncharacterized protein n=1 Tax=Ancylostoma ceylanicum TaxID=53326 RepID=A0A016X1A4_9BILA|nr:hypothetical protein Y032_0420g1156 [Ancylostoma ceylanicum]